MTVLEQEKSVSTVNSMSDRYITPEYLAHLPTSVSSRKQIELWQNHETMCCGWDRQDTLSGISHCDDCQPCHMTNIVTGVMLSYNCLSVIIATPTNIHLKSTKLSTFKCAARLSQWCRPSNYFKQQSKCIFSPLWHLTKTVDTFCIGSLQADWLAVNRLLLKSQICPKFCHNEGWMALDSFNYIF